jgi:hypothetical protein
MFLVASVMLFAGGKRLQKISVVFFIVIEWFAAVILGYLAMEFVGFHFYTGIDDAISWSLWSLITLIPNIAYVPFAVAMLNPELYLDTFGGKKNKVMWGINWGVLAAIMVLMIISFIVF